MQLINATDLDRKSGGAQWRDLRFGGSFLEMFFLQGGLGFFYFASLNARSSHQAASMALRYPAKMIRGNDWEAPWHR
jgi:hypothetical protein